jgi:hypothetical protein
MDVLTKELEKFDGAARIRARWQATLDGQAFFIPCLNHEEEIPLILALGYVPGRSAPEAKPGMYRGLWGVLCFRGIRKTSAVRLKSRKPIVIEGA